MNCKNCNEKLTGKEHFCSNCGQKNITNLNLKYLLDDFLDNYLSLDSKLFKTIKKLVFSPGFLSMEFLQGRRAGYVPPVKFYIAVSVLFFFLISVSDFIPSNNEKTEFKAGFTYDNKKIEIPPEKYKELELTDGFDAYIKDSLHVNNVFWIYMVKKMIIANNNWDSFTDTLKNQLSLFLLLFIPFISLIYKWTFSRNKYGYIKHVVFNIHFNSFLIIVLIFNQFAEFFIDRNYLLLSIFLGLVVYLFISIMNFYKRKWWCVLYKMFFLLIGYVLSLIIFIALLFFVSLIITN